MKISHVDIKKIYITLSALLHYYFLKAPSRKFLTPTLSDSALRQEKVQVGLGTKRKNPRLQNSKWTQYTLFIPLYYKVCFEYKFKRFCCLILSLKKRGPPRSWEYVVIYTSFESLYSFLTLDIFNIFIEYQRKPKPMF